ncbi:hypothetical protein WJX74_005500 [Apatococcus lobatus]|uniref:7,8-dihydroneopterin aldolase n=1 Tax=Apatococcus lobatus TaxID=904363 RepID=A0AAW1QJ51_9CHLO
MQAYRRLVGRAINLSHLNKRLLTTRDLSERSQPSDAILLKGLQFFGYHGVLKEEQTLGQKFCVDARLTCCLKAAGHSDDLQDTISYAEVFSDIQQVMEGPSHALLESVAHTISRQLLEKYPKVTSVELRLTKPHVAVPGQFLSLGIETMRIQRHGRGQGAPQT